MRGALVKASAGQEHRPSSARQPRRRRSIMQQRKLNTFFKPVDSKVNVKLPAPPSAPPPAHATGPRPDSMDLQIDNTLASLLLPPQESQRDLTQAAAGLADAAVEMLQEEPDDSDEVPQPGLKMVPLAEVFKRKRAGSTDLHEAVRPAPAIRTTLSDSHAGPEAVPVPTGAAAAPIHPGTRTAQPAPAPAPASTTAGQVKVLTQAEMEAQAQERLHQCEQLCEQASGSQVPLPLQQLLLDPGWCKALAPIIAHPSFAQLSVFVHAEYRKGKVYPPRERIFHALNACPLDQVRVVIVGQDPYPNAGQAMGLCFSVNRGIRVPQSLINIYKELQQDPAIGCPVPKHGDLSSWSTQGVLMLNTMLTVRERAAASHKKQGWETFTDAAITAVSKNCTGVVFLLWGKPAQEKAKLVDCRRHHVLKAAHPSPLAAASGNYFVGCRHFSTANELLSKQGKPPINWCIE